MGIGSEKYVSLTTFKRDGTAKAVPVWIADLDDGAVGFTTASSSYKVKRINNDARVLLQPSDAKGNVAAGSEPISGTATVDVGGPEFDRVRGIVAKKYGLQYRAISLLGSFMRLIGRGSGTDAAVTITLD